MNAGGAENEHFLHTEARAIHFKIYKHSPTWAIQRFRSCIPNHSNDSRGDRSMLESSVTTNDTVEVTCVEKRQDVPKMIRHNLFTAHLGYLLFPSITIGRFNCLPHIARLQFVDEGAASRFSSAMPRTTCISCAQPKNMERTDEFCGRLLVPNVSAQIITATISRS